MFISMMAMQFLVAKPLWEQCTYNFLTGFCYCVLHAVTGSVRYLLSPSITDKLLNNNSKAYT